MSQEVSVSEMKTMSIEYAQRMLDADNASGVNVSLKKEFLMMDIDKGSMESIINAPNFAGAYAIFGLEEKDGYSRQTIILVPHDDTGKAIPLQGGSTIKGIEENMQLPPPVKDICFPNGGSTPNIPQGVQNIFDSHGMV